jgi:hypothetical protein
MLGIILSEDEDFFRTIWRRLRLGRYSVIRYRDPIKLSDNLEELSPDLVVIKVSDYPLHWQILASQSHFALPHKAISFALYAPPGLRPPAFLPGEKVFWFSEYTAEKKSEIAPELALTKFSNFLSGVLKMSIKSQSFDASSDRETDSFHQSSTKSRLMAAVERREGYSRP